jgi:hypothetical protein
VEDVIMPDKYIDAYVMPVPKSKVALLTVAIAL